MPSLAKYLMTDLNHNRMFSLDYLAFDRNLTAHIIHLAFDILESWLDFSSMHLEDDTYLKLSDSKSQ